MKFLKLLIIVSMSVILSGCITAQIFSENPIFEKSYEKSNESDRIYALAYGGVKDGNKAIKKTLILGDKYIYVISDKVKPSLLDIYTKIPNKKNLSICSSEPLQVNTNKKDNTIEFKSEVRLCYSGFSHNNILTNLNFKKINGKMVLDLAVDGIVYANNKKNKFKEYRFNKPYQVNFYQASGSNFNLGNLFMNMLVLPFVLVGEVAGSAVFLPLAGAGALLEDGSLDPDK